MDEASPASSSSSRMSGGALRRRPVGLRTWRGGMRLGPRGGAATRPPLRRGEPASLEAGDLLDVLCCAAERGTGEWRGKCMRGEGAVA